jgi:hypothetical protein
MAAPQDADKPMASFLKSLFGKLGGGGGGAEAEGEAVE